MPILRISRHSVNLAATAAVPEPLLYTGRNGESMTCRALFLIGLPALVAASPVSGASLRIVEEGSVFAVVTHRGGLGAALAHNHFVTADLAGAALEFDAENLLGTRFRLDAKVEELIVDGPGQHERWSSRLLELDILDDAPADISDGDRDKIRASMLDKKQLDSRSFPDLRVELESLSRRSSQVGDTRFPFEALLLVKIHGQTRRVEAAVRHRVDGDTLHLEGVATAKFSDFGIKPFSAMLGALKNLDEFHFFLSLQAVASSGNAE